MCDDDDEEAEEGGGGRASSEGTDSWNEKEGGRGKVQVQKKTMYLKNDSVVHVVVVVVVAGFVGVVVVGFGDSQPPNKNT